MLTSTSRSLSLADHLRSAPFELILSSGFFGFFAHAGVIEALEEAKLRPSLCGGSSAGALVAGLWAAGLSAEALRERLFGLRRQDFWDLDPRLGLARGATGPGLLRGEAFGELLRSSLVSIGVRAFADCRIPVRVVVYAVDRRRTVVLAAGELAAALRASCSLPGLFQPISIDGVRYLDGGIGDRAGILAATPGARVLYHHLQPTSPWRLFWRSQNAPPARPELHLLSAHDLPRLSPFHLERGVAAYERARDMARAALKSPVESRS